MQRIRLWVLLLGVLALPITAGAAAGVVAFVTEAQLANALHPQVIAEGYAPEVEIKVNKLSQPLVSKSEFPELLITDLSIQKSTRSFTAKAATADAPEKPVMIFGRLLTKAEVPVLANPINRGQIIGADDIVLIQVDEQEITNRVITNVQDLVGQEARRPIQAKSLLRADMIRSPILVHKNTVVTITYQTDALSITHQVRATEDGSLGEAVRVINPGTNKNFIATVSGQNQVIIGNMPPKPQISAKAE